MLPPNQDQCKYQLPQSFAFKQSSPVFFLQRCINSSFQKSKQHLFTSLDSLDRIRFIPQFCSLFPTMTLLICFLKDKDDTFLPIEIISYYGTIKMFSRQHFAAYSKSYCYL